MYKPNRTNKLGTYCHMSHDKYANGNKPVFLLGQKQSTRQIG